MLHGFQSFQHLALPFLKQLVLGLANTGSIEKP